MKYCHAFLIALTLLGTGCAGNQARKSENLPRKKSICRTIAKVIKIENKREIPNDPEINPGGGSTMSIGDLTLKTDRGTTKVINVPLVYVKETEEGLGIETYIFVNNKDPNETRNCIEIF